MPAVSPFSVAEELDAGAVHQKVQWPVGTALQVLDLCTLRVFRLRRVVGKGPVQPGQAQEARDHPCGPPERQLEQNLDRQAEQDRGIRIDRRVSLAFLIRCVPGHLLVQRDQQRPTLPERIVVGGRKSEPRRSALQPNRQAPTLMQDPERHERAVSKPACHTLGIARASAARDRRAITIHNTDRNHFQRNIQTRMVFHRSFPHGCGPCGQHTGPRAPPESGRRNQTMSCGGGHVPWAYRSAQSNAIDVGISAQDTLIVDARLAVALREVGLTRS
ncbi:hypothetical protein SAMN04488245_1404 [Alloyangia pacifica]|uniref:Uncharacterized protein n=1 Tax=Alloyangia pacifica TaxID=311180 RepID=A0A1I6WNN8_9RHOB|nr:hypothetical protein SAMN04488245_1404 [Alloyangia pacifica]SFT27526.1 hypothetical protein SAMN04488050_1334 [Alloyangia pacifica]